MKNLKFNVITIALCLAAAIPVGLKAQHLEIGPFAGYETTGKVYTSLGYLRVSGGANFGGMVSFGLDEDAQFEFSYNHMNGTLSLDNGEHIINSTPVNVDYYMFGLVGATRLGDKWLPFYGGSLGWVHYGTPDEKYGNESLFAINIQAGMKFLITEKIGIKIQARLLMPLYASGYYFAGTGGTGYGVTSTCVMVQGDFTGGLYFIID
jgi:hypothetical protein